ncbi:MAG TPA: TIGR03557 family F420-dependent LLM class oxidoreductase [Gaiellaceae bacterium]|nr:TIGR03557 family F420-dependent LLM class oxidoreductase [Gaiellaceae bacterium]
MKVGYAFSSEDHPPATLVAHAREAEEHGFEFGLVSDHYHPWIDAQGHSPFVWTTIGAILASTSRLRIGTGVTCPLMRIHPAIVAQAAATCAALAPGRFFLGVGSGENLNEHVLGDRWPGAGERLEMTEEAIDVMRQLWEGGVVNHRGRHYTVEDARLYTLPEQPVELVLAAGKPNAAELAGRVADGLVNTSPDKEVVQAFERGGGKGKPRYGMLHVCVHEDEAEARRLAHELWPNIALGGELSREIKNPEDFQSAVEPITEDAVAEVVPCGNDPQKHLEQIERFADVGFDHVWVHQIGEDQTAFFRFYRDEVLPTL